MKIIHTSDKENTSDDEVEVMVDEMIRNYGIKRVMKKEIKQEHAIAMYEFIIRKRKYLIHKEKHKEINVSEAASLGLANSIISRIEENDNQ